MVQRKRGLRLRYEFSRQFALHIDVKRYQTLSNTPTIKADGGSSSETRLVAGPRVWLKLVRFFHHPQRY
ncbi:MULTISPECIES: copper resistance protein B [Ralstonia]|uniref:copper resistance protein B n=1 Tax=Ralstonia TaxID=48736 RepID=UPI001CE2835D|nr:MULTISPECIES: copper resistance protein B [Ralstonia]UCA17448.1 copper resistance protein B [Ralstonia pickettii]